MEFRKEMLDQRICDVFKELPTKSTFRQTIREMEAMLNESCKDLDSMTSEEINKYAAKLNKQIWETYRTDAK